MCRVLNEKSKPVYPSNIWLQSKINARHMCLVVEREGEAFAVSS